MPRQVVALKQGIGADIAKSIVRAIKDSKPKVQAAIQGGELRITCASPSRDRSAAR